MKPEPETIKYNHAHVGLVTQFNPVRWWRPPGQALPELGAPLPVVVVTNETSVPAEVPVDGSYHHQPVHRRCDSG